MIKHLNLIERGDKMLKVEITVKENKDSDSCKATIVAKNVEKATECEKRCGATVYNEVNKILTNLGNEKGE